MPDKAHDRLLAAFRQQTGHDPDGIWSAPGRVNLIGEHLDYNGGCVLPLAIGLRTRVGLSRRSDNRVCCWSLQDEVMGDVGLDGDERVDGWPAYAVGTVAAIRGQYSNVRGVNIVVDGQVPLGGGLASSAALECSVALAINDIFALSMTREDLALAGQRAEHEAVGAPVGVMDQFASLFGTAGHGVLLDCATLKHRAVPIPLQRTQTEILVIDTGITHDLASGEYAARRRDCEAVAAELGVEYLAQADPRQINEIQDDVIRRRARHVVTEQHRVSSIVSALERCDMEAVGRILISSHRSLRDDFEVSVPEVDGTVEATVDAGCLGARLTGGGFGGCVIALIERGSAEHIMSVVRRQAVANGWPEPKAYDGAPKGPATQDR